MQTYASKSVPGRKFRELGLVEASEVAVRSDVAEHAAIERLEKKAAEKGADAIIGYKISQVIVGTGTFGSGNECTVSGIAVKFID